MSRKIKQSVEDAERRFVRRMRNIRNDLEYTQERMAEKAGLERFVIAALENDTRPRNLRLNEAIQICDALGVDLAAMLGPREPVAQMRIEFHG